MSVPVDRSSYASASADEAWDALSRMYTQARPHTSSSEAALTVDSAATPLLAADRVWLHAAEGAFAESPDQLNVITVLTGRITLDFGRHGVVANRGGNSYLYLPDSPALLEWDTFSALALRLPMSEVTTSAGGMADVSAQDFRFTSVRPLSPGHEQLWMRTVSAVWRELVAADDQQLNLLIHRELFDTVVAAALAVFPSTAMTRGYIPGPGDVRPAAVRRAVAFIDSCASLPITVTDMAEAAGVTPRALRAGFRRHLDTTPVDYLRRVRLTEAHRDLQAADPTCGPTVAQIAVKWGFRRRDRFSDDYHQMFGVAAEETLRS